MRRERSHAGLDEDEAAYLTAIPVREPDAEPAKPPGARDVGQVSVALLKVPGGPIRNDVCRRSRRSKTCSGSRFRSRQRLSAEFGTDADATPSNANYVSVLDSMGTGRRETNLSSHHRCVRAPAVGLPSKILIDFTLLLTRIPMRRTRSLKRGSAIASIQGRQQSVSTGCCLVRCRPAPACPCRKRPFRLPRQGAAL
jgi:hypothetical protein